MPNNLTQEDFAYAAGILDGEGYIAVVSAPSKSRGRTISTKGKIYLHHDSRISVTITRPEVPEWLQQKFGGTVYGRKMKGNWKDQFTWLAMGNQNKEILLRGIIPFLKIKKAQAESVLEYTLMAGQSNPTRRSELARICKELNKKGKPVETNTQDSPEDDMEMKIESELIGDYERADVVTHSTAPAVLAA